MRGHGRSFYPEAQHQYSEKLTVEDMEAILDKVVGEDKSAIVGGLSLGGYMSQAFYRDHPMRVEALLIIGEYSSLPPEPHVPEIQPCHELNHDTDTGPGFKKDSARAAWNATAHETAANLDKNGLSHLQDSSPERARVSHRNAEGLAMAARGMLAQQNDSVIQALPNIKVPSLVLVGGDDTPFLAASEYMAQKIPGAKKVVVPGAGHAANIDQPEKFNEAVLGFLKGLDERGGGQKARL